MIQRPDFATTFRGPSKGDHFYRLYIRWLEARASWVSPDGDDRDEATDAKSDAVDEAGRQLVVMPALSDWMIWKKWEVLEFYLDDDVVASKHVDNRTVMALGCIKADLMRLGIGGEAE